MTDARWIKRARLIIVFAALSACGGGSGDNELFDVLAEMLLELEDPHVLLDTPLGTSTYTGWFDRYPTNFDDAVVMATYLGPTP